MIRCWHAGLTVASIQPKLLLLTRMVRSDYFLFFFFSVFVSNVFVIVFEPFCVVGESIAD